MALFALAAWLCWWLSGFAFERGGVLVYVLTGAVIGAVLAKLATEVTRRLHDTGRSGRFGLAVLGLFGGVSFLITTSSLAYQPAWLAPALVIATGLAVAALLLRPGVLGGNRYGLPVSGPLGHASGGPIGHHRALIWATVSILGCALVALAIIDISNGMREAHEHDARFAAHELGR